MQPVEFPGSREIKKPESMTDEECMSIWAISSHDMENDPWFITAWKPSYEDMQALSCGEPIYIKTIARGLPPMALFTLDEDGQANDAG